MRNTFNFFFLLAIIVLLSETGLSQIPNDSNFVAGKITCEFRLSIINRNYFCLDSLMEWKYNYITPNYTLITDSAIVNSLSANNATLEHSWSDNFNPCVDTMEITQWGDTLRLIYWTDYIIHFPDSIGPLTFAHNLEQVNINAFVHITPILKPNNIEIANEDAFSIVNISPNPANEKINVRFAVTEYNNYYFSIIDIYGNEVIQSIKTGLIEPAIHIIEIPVQLISSGVYFCKLSSGNGKYYIKPFIVNR